VAVVKVEYTVGARTHEYTALPTDIKPTVGVPPSSTLYEIGTGRKYILNNGAWEEDINLSYVLDPDTLEPVILTQPIIKTDTLNATISVAGLALESGGNLDNISTNTGKLAADLLTTTRITTVGSYTYIGKAAIGAAEGSAVWQVKRLDTASGLIKLWADGNANYDNIWTNYASLNYA
jgi:hypothetical protein